MKRQTGTDWDALVAGLVPRYGLVLLTVVAGYNFLVYHGGRLLSAGADHYELQLPFEKRIPLLTWTVWIYVLCFLFWAWNYMLAMGRGRREALRFVLADLLGKTVCFFFFLFLPTTLQRPEIVGNSCSDVMLRFIYRVDAADNLFPSIHCLVSWMCFIAVRKNPKITAAYRVFSFLFALAVCVSTLTIRQHVLADAAAGIILAEGCYVLSDRILLKNRSKLPAFFTEET